MLVSDLVEFLRARLAEDEQTARRALGGEWTCLVAPRFAAPGERGEIEVGGQVLAVPTPETGLHIARHDPARTLREVAAKRAIIDEHEITHDTVTAEGNFSSEPGCGTCHEMDGETYAGGYCRTLRLLALPYADHPDYDESWRHG